MNNDNWFLECIGEKIVEYNTIQFRFSTVHGNNNTLSRKEYYYDDKNRKNIFWDLETGWLKQEEQDIIEKWYQKTLREKKLKRILNGREKN